MRVFAAFGPLLVIVSTFVACASFTEGAPGTPPSSTDGGTTDDGGTTTTDDGGTSGTDAKPPVPKSCAQRSGTPLLCEDFENLNLTIDWTPQEANGKVGAITDATRGGMVLSAAVTPVLQGAQAQLERDVTWTPPFYIRFYAYMDQALASENYQFLAVLSKIELGVSGRRLIINQFESPPVGFLAPSPVDFPLKKWTCVEWFVDLGTTTLSVDGALQVSQMKLTNGATNFFAFGLGHNDVPNSAAGSILYDDLVVSSTPVGCD